MQMQINVFKMKSFIEVIFHFNLMEGWKEHKFEVLKSNIAILK